MSTTILPECVWPLDCELGESPAWSSAAQLLWFVDIKGRRVICHAPGTQRGQSWLMPNQPGFALPASDGRLVVGMPGGLYRFNPDTCTLECLVTLEQDRPGNRLNDASIDAAGRLWFGSMDDAEQARSDTLYSWHHGVLTRHDDGICITNGPVTSPDGRTLYHTGTLARAIHAFDLAPDGALSRKRLFLA